MIINSLWSTLAVHLLLYVLALTHTHPWSTSTLTTTSTSSLTSPSTTTTSFPLYVYAIEFDSVITKVDQGSSSNNNNDPLQLSATVENTDVSVEELTRLIPVNPTDKQKQTDSSTTTTMMMMTSTTTTTTNPTPTTSSATEAATTSPPPSPPPTPTPTPTPTLSEGALSDPPIIMNSSFIPPSSSSSLPSFDIPTITAADIESEEESRWWNLGGNSDTGMPRRKRIFIKTFNKELNKTITTMKYLTPPTSSDKLPIELLSTRLVLRRSLLGDFVIRLNKHLRGELMHTNVDTNEKKPLYPPVQSQKEFFHLLEQYRREYKQRREEEVVKLNHEYMVRKQHKLLHLAETVEHVDNNENNNGNSSTAASSTAAGSVSPSTTVASSGTKQQLSALKSINSYEALARSNTTLLHALQESKLKHHTTKLAALNVTGTNGVAEWNFELEEEAKAINSTITAAQKPLKTKSKPTSQNNVKKGTAQTTIPSKKRKRAKKLTNSTPFRIKFGRVEMEADRLVEETALLSRVIDEQHHLQRNLSEGEIQKQARDEAEEELKQIESNADLSNYLKWLQQQQHTSLTHSQRQMLAQQQNKTSGGALDKEEEDEDDQEEEDEPETTNKKTTTPASTATSNEPKQLDVPLPTPPVHNAKVDESSTTSSVVATSTTSDAATANTVESAASSTPIDSTTATDSTSTSTTDDSANAADQSASVTAPASSEEESGSTPASDADSSSSTPNEVPSEPPAAQAVDSSATPSATASAIRETGSTYFARLQKQIQQAKVAKEEPAKTSTQDKLSQVISEQKAKMQQQADLQLKASQASSLIVVKEPEVNPLSAVPAAT